MRLAKALAKARRGLAYLTETAVLDFTIDLQRTLKAKQVSQAELARRIGTSPAYISKVMNGQSNLTVKSMVALAHVLDCRVRIEIEAIHVPAIQAEWKHVGTAQSNRIHVSARPINEIDAANEAWVTLKAA